LDGNDGGRSQRVSSDRTAKLHLKFEGSGDRGNGDDEQRRRNTSGGGLALKLAVITVIRRGALAEEAVTSFVVDTRASVLTGDTVRAEAHATADTDDTVEETVR